MQCWYFDYIFKNSTQNARAPHTLHPTVEESYPLHSSFSHSAPLRTLRHTYKTILAAILSAFVWRSICIQGNKHAPQPLSLQLQYCRACSSETPARSTRSHTDSISTNSEQTIHALTFCRNVEHEIYNLGALTYLLTYDISYSWEPAWVLQENQWNNCDIPVIVTTSRDVCKKVWTVDWLSSVLRPLQHSIGYMGDGFYRSKDPTNSIKVLKKWAAKENNTKNIEKTENTHTQNSIQITVTQINTASPLVYNNMGWLGDSSHRGQVR